MTSAKGKTSGATAQVASDPDPCPICTLCSHPAHLAWGPTFHWQPHSLTILPTYRHSYTQGISSHNPTNLWKLTMLSWPHLMIAALPP